MLGTCRVQKTGIVHAKLEYSTQNWNFGGWPLAQGGHFEEGGYYQENFWVPDFLYKSCHLKI